MARTRPAAGAAGATADLPPVAGAEPARVGRRAAGPGRSLLARASGVPALHGGRGGVDRALAAGVRAGLTGWVQVGALVRRLRGERIAREQDADRLFALLCGLCEDAVDGRPLPVDVSAQARRSTHVRLVATALPAAEAMAAVSRAMRPYATASSATDAPPVAVGYYALADLLAQRARDFSLQVVHLTPPDGPHRVDLHQLSIQLPRRTPLAEGTPLDDDLPSRPDLWLAGLADVAGLRRVPLASDADLLGTFGVRTSPAPDPTHVRTSVAATAPATVTQGQALRLVELALGRVCDARTPARPLAPAVAGPGMLAQEWLVAIDGHELPLTVATRLGGRRRPTQVVLTLLAPALEQVPLVDEVDLRAQPVTRESPGLYSAPDQLTGSRQAGAAGDPEDVALTHELAIRPIWWRSVGGRLDGDDVVLYETAVAGRRLRVRANDYPAEPMYTLLVGPHGAVTAALDLERWPSEWARPMFG